LTDRVRQPPWESVGAGLLFLRRERCDREVRSSARIKNPALPLQRTERQRRGTREIISAAKGWASPHTTLNTTDKHYALQSREMAVRGLKMLEAAWQERKDE
jgi:hypothetical protein